MTRIIQRCFLVLALTGVLLSNAQNTTLSDASSTTSQLSKASTTSSPESSSKLVESSTFDSPESKTEEESVSSAQSSAETSSENVGGTNETTSSSKNNSDDVSDNSVDSTSVESESTESDQHRLESSTSVPNVSNSEGLLKAELQDDESRGTEIPPEKPSESSVVENSSKESSNEKEENLSDANTTNGKKDSLSEGSEITSMASANGDENATKVDVFTNSTEESLFKNASKDFQKNSVPSKEKMISNSSYVDEKKSPEEIFSTTPSNIENDENEINETAKSATRKRSLNATNILSKATTETISEPFSSSKPAATFLSTTLAPSKIEEGTSLVEEMTTAHTSSGANNEDDMFTTRNYPEIETTSFPPHLIDGGVQNTEFEKDFGADSFHESDHVGAELASVSYVHDVHISPESSAALSTLRKESLHPVESMDDTAQIPNETRKMSTAFPSSQKPSDQEMASAASINHSEFLVTFDPDGMTHNFSQEPDSVTFSPGVYHFSGIPSDEYFSRLENDEFIEHETETMLGNAKITEAATHAPKGNFSEREREIEIPNPDLFPHDEPDIDIVPTGNFDISTKHPAVPNQLSTSNSNVLSSFVTSGSKIALPSNDESEEMMNDSPHFDQTQSKSTAIPAAQLKNIPVDKNFEMHVSNDITHSASFGPQYTPEIVNELEFSTEYQTEQSEIRPVTVVSPSKTSESITVLSVLPKLVSNSPLESANSGQPEIVLPHTSSPIILPNLAPSVLNQSAENITHVVQFGTTAQNNASDLISKSGDGTASTIAGVAVKTSVSVSFPLSTIQNGTENPAVLQAIKDFLSNTSGAILPVPIIKDINGHPALTVETTDLSSAASTDAPITTTTTSSGIRIRKPTPRRPSGDSTNERATPRTRKPFLVPPPKSATTEGPSVPSIFKKNRTRLGSITSSTTARPFRPYSTIRIHYASRLPGMLPGGELVISTEPITTTTTMATTTETEEPFSDEPFTEQTQSPIFPSEDNVTLLKVAGYIVLTKGLRWNSQLNERRSPLYKERADFVQKQLYRLFRSSPIAFHLWKIEIDGFSIKGGVNNVAVDFFLYLVKTENDFSMEQLTSVFHDKLKNNTFSRFTVDTNGTAFQYVSDELMHSTTEPPEKEPEPVLPQWAIAVIVVGAASLIFIVLFAAVAILGRHHVRRRYSNKLDDEDSERPSDWESKMAAAYENLAADTIYDVEDMHSDTYKKSYLVD